LHAFGQAVLLLAVLSSMHLLIRKNIPALLLAMLVLGSCQMRQSLLMAMGWKEVPAQQKSRVSAQHASCVAFEIAQSSTSVKAPGAIKLHPAGPRLAAIPPDLRPEPAATPLKAQRTGVQQPPLYVLYRQWKDEICVC
jgi:hypothetical protein